MFKMSAKQSITISLVLAVIFLVACIIGIFFLYPLTDMLISVEDNIGNRDVITIPGRVFVHIMAYAALTDVIIADIMLFFLLLRVKKGKVFTDISVSLIRGIAWCCMILCPIFAALGIYFQLALIVAFAGLFLGICMRVIKNVIEEATRIKSENDLTV